ncbi:MAG: hypothetical protein M3384_02930 [Acidobacteriota bacterium]|nr:hypothetical protein [Acidobacteriota bacterium]
MKKLLPAILLLSFSSLAVLAQSRDNPPPPPLLYLAPAKAEIKEFVSKEHNFSVAFPGVPKAEVKQAKDARESVFKVYRQGSYSVVTVWEFKNDAEKRREEFLKKYRESILNTSPPFGGRQMLKPSIISENDIQIGKYKGKEFAYEADIKFTRTLLLFAGKRIYEIKADVTNWHILREYQKNKAEDFLKEAERFFNSFKLLN